MAVYQRKMTHFVLLPFLAQGHTIPMVDIARLLAKHGVLVTVLTTPHNGNRFKSVVNRAIESGLRIRVQHLKLPCVEAGLPEGCENFDMLVTINDAMKFLAAASMLKDQVREALKQLEPLPSCLLSDMCYPWSSKVAKEMDIPRIVFHGMSCFSLLCRYLMRISEDFGIVNSDSEYFVVPGLPDRIEMTKVQLRGTYTQMPEEWRYVRNDFQQAEDAAFGCVANTFQELESEYVEAYKKVREGKKLWCIGPVSLCNEDELDIAERGNKPSIDEHQCLEWLHKQEKSSVIYACLGSISRLSAPQLIELGLALQESKRPFVWVIRDASEGFKTRLLEEKIEENTRGRGLFIYGWAPQVLILSHPSVGGFLTHCGWNSSLEGITAGLPMITWPIFAEQFCNEKLIVNVIKTGIRVGAELPVVLGDEEKMGVMVKHNEIKTVIDQLMDGGEEGSERRERARKMAEKARRATMQGGSSHHNITLLIQDVIEFKENEELPPTNGSMSDHERCDDFVAP